ncbi:peroxiredoxin family protein [Paenarthrobacter aromaticivorans]|uniref:peroxiredoxin family protein n=1 Tax=Paenarthrobacter aromaticivorans TaxID=2849150 RepID=UPI003A7F6E71
MSAVNGNVLHLDLIDTEGKEFALQSGRATFVYFMRAPTCQQCNSAVRKLAAKRDTLRGQGVDVVIALPTGTDDAVAWKTAKSVPLDVVTGRTGTAHEEAGLLRRVFGLIQQSGGILLDANGVVRYSHIVTNPGDSLRLQELEEAIANMPVSR